MDELHGEVEITRTDAAIMSTDLGAGLALLVQHGKCTGCGVVQFRAILADAMFDLKNWQYPTTWEE